MFSLRTHAFITGGLFAALVIIAIAGNAFAPNGLEATPGFLTRAFQIFYLTLFGAFGLSTIPLIVKTVLRSQERLGNQDKAPVAAAIKHQNRIIWVMMGLMLLGAAIAIPAMILDGGFDSTPAHTNAR